MNKTDLDGIMALVIKKGLEIVLALVVLIIGIYVIKFLLRLAKKRFEARNVDLSLRDFLASILNFMLYIMLIIIVASMVGIPAASFIAILGAAGLAIGLALQGSLSNFAGGVLILLFKPIKVGEFVETVDASGTVDKIDILYTTLHSPDNKMIFAPNGQLANSVITNYSRMPFRRVDFTIGISYDSDINKAKQVLMETVLADKRVHKEPAPVVLVSELAASSVNLVIRVWANKEDYWDIFHDKQEQFKAVLEANNISLPFPQRELHIINKNEA